MRMASSWKLQSVQKDGVTSNEPDVAEFILCADSSDLTTSRLIAAFHQTGGRLYREWEEQIQTSNQFLNSESNHNHERILEAIQSEREKGTIVLGYNAIWKDSWMWSKLDSRLLPIGEGLLLMRVAGKSGNGGGTSGGGRGGAIG
ncbi:hypothetical protein R6Q57_002905 [Mikania cordata]